MNTAVKAATLCALAALAACTRTVTTREVVREQPIVQHQVTPERTVIVQPPAPQSETMPPPPAAAGYSWVPAYYEWRNGKWLITQGSETSGSPEKVRRTVELAPSSIPVVAIPEATALIWQSSTGWVSSGVGECTVYQDGRIASIDVLPGLD